MALNKKLQYIWASMRHSISGRLIEYGTKHKDPISKLMSILYTISHLIALIEIQEPNLSKKEVKKLFQHGVTYILSNSELNLPKVPKPLERLIFSFLVK